MSRLLAYTSPARGHLFPLVPILLELKRRGHTIALRTLASEVDAMRALGFDAEPIDPVIETIEHDDYLARTPVGANKRVVGALCVRALHDAPDLRRAIERVRPDALLVDETTYGAAAAAEAWGGPWATWWPFPTPLPSRDAPPFGPGLRPAAGPLGRLRDAVTRPLLIGTAERIVRPRVDEVRVGLGLPPLADVTEFFIRSPLVIYLTAEPFEYPRSDWPAEVRMVGPCHWEPPADEPDWLTADGDPFVLVSTSSEFQDDAKLARVAMEALADQPYRVLVTVPSHDVSGFSAPSNARVVPFVRHDPVLRWAACAVTHGGMGVTQKALSHGVPVCAVPFGRDQLEVARRVELSGAGTRLSPGRLTPRRLRAAVATAVGRRAGAERVAEAYRAAGGAVAAADAFVRLLSASA